MQTELELLYEEREELRALIDMYDHEITYLEEYIANKSGLAGRIATDLWKAQTRRAELRANFAKNESKIKSLKTAN